MIGICLPCPPTALPFTKSLWYLVSTINNVSLDLMPRNELLHTFWAFSFKNPHQVFFAHLSGVVIAMLIKDLLNDGYSPGRYAKQLSKVVFGFGGRSGSRRHCEFAITFAEI